MAANLAYTTVMVPRAQKLPVAPARPFAALADRLSKAGLRPTRQRLALARLLFSGMARHVTAETLHKEAVTAGQQMSLATVYNALHQFKAAGLLRSVAMDGGATYFDTNTSDHHHFFDVGTSQFIDIAAGAILVSALPPLPKGSVVERVDVVVRIRRPVMPGRRSRN